MTVLTDACKTSLRMKECCTLTVNLKEEAMNNVKALDWRLRQGQDLLSKSKEWLDIFVSKRVSNTFVWL